MNYIEKFEVKKGGTKFNLVVSQEPDDSIFSNNGKGGFKPWAGGCGIGSCQTTKTIARGILFGYITMEIKNRITKTKKELAELEALQTALGDDVFNLGQFKVKA